MRTKRVQLKEGDRYNKLVVIKKDHQDIRWRWYFECQCDCGNKKVIQGAAIVSGNTKSCGCIVGEVANKRRLPNGKGTINQIILGYKRHAKRRDFIWSLSYQEAYQLFMGNCYYCGDPPTNTKTTKNDFLGVKYNGIDRIDSNLDYITSNVVSCCRICNLAKRDYSVKDFLSWIERVHKYQNK